MNINSANPNQNWMQGAVQNPGGLHRALNVPMGQTIPLNRIHAAAQKPGHLGQMGRLAEVFAKNRP